MITGGNNIGRVGIVEHRERHPGSYDIVHVKDATGAVFATRGTNVFIIGKSTKSLVSLPRRKGIRSTILQDQEHRAKRSQAAKAK